MPSVAAAVAVAQASSRLLLGEESAHVARRVGPEGHALDRRAILEEAPLGSIALVMSAQSQKRVCGASATRPRDGST